MRNLDIRLHFRKEKTGNGERHEARKGKKLKYKERR